MKKLLFAVLAVAVLSVSGAQAAVKMDEKYFTVKAPKIEEIAEDRMVLDSISHRMKPSVVEAAPSADPFAEINLAEVFLDKIVNFGKKAWNIVSANQPVVNIQTDVANALPTGVAAWQSMQGWQTPVSKVFHVSYENLYGMTTVDFTYRVLFTPGGNINGRGAYLTQVTVIPADVHVVWGFTFNMKASVPSITNAGTSQSPVAGAQVQVAWDVNTVVSHNEEIANYYVRGDGMFTDLNNGN